MNRLIRVMQVSDIESCLSLWRQVYGVMLNGPANSALALESFLVRNRDMGFVAEEDGMMVGAILCGHQAEQGDLDYLAVWPTQRRCGHARDLVTAALLSLAGQGVTHCHAFVSKRNVESLPFWASVNAELNDDVHFMTMQLDIETAPTA